MSTSLLKLSLLIKYQWKGRAWLGEDKIAFDSLMNKARSHAPSCTVTPMLEPIDAVFLSILVEQEKEIDILRKSLIQKLANLE
jgi:hypothetical protein